MDGTPLPADGDTVGMRASRRVAAVYAVIRQASISQRLTHALPIAVVSEQEHVLNRHVTLPKHPLLTFARIRETGAGSPCPLRLGREKEMRMLRKLLAALGW